MPNFGYHLARAEGHAVRNFYAGLLSAGVRFPRLKQSRELPYEVYSYSGENALPEQVASIRSLLRYAGHPKKFTVVSDGTYSPRSIELLHALDPVVSVSNFKEWMPPSSPNELSAYFNDHPTGKQLALAMSLPCDGPALYLDSDVLFFPGASNALAFSGLSYLADCQLSADERLFRSEEEKENPVNTGVLFLSQKLDWSLGMERLRQLTGQPTFFTNQTVTHLVLHANGAKALDPRRFVLQLDDQFIYPDKYAGPAIALRHYVQPVRHKFWTSLRRRCAS